MIRLQVQLTEEQAARLRRLANDRGVSVAAVVREAVDAAAPTAADDPWERALAVVGTYRSGGADGAREHDRELAGIFAR